MQYWMLAFKFKARSGLVFLCQMAVDSGQELFQLQPEMLKPDRHPQMISVVQEILLSYKRMMFLESSKCLQEYSRGHVHTGVKSVEIQRAKMCRSAAYMRSA
jgi:hypothetical protein